MLMFQMLQRQFTDQPTLDQELIRAIQNKNDLSIIESIIRKGANVNCTNSAGATPLHLACDNGHTETASALIGNGAK